MIIRGATISPCDRFRYRLWRRWADGPSLVFVMLNPSTADGVTDDPTIRKCIGFATKLGYGAIEVLNLFAYRATKPVDLVRAGYPIGSENNDALRSAAIGSSHSGLPIVCAWGAHARSLDRPRDVVALLLGNGARLCVLGHTTDGIPRHPLYLPYSSTLKAYEPK